MTERLMTYVREADFAQFAIEAHRGFANGHLGLREVERLLREMCDYLQGAEDDTSSRYLSPEGNVRCFVDFISLEIGRQLRDGRIVRDGSRLSGKGGVLDVAALQQLPDSESEWEACWLDQLLEEPEQHADRLRLLDCFDETYAAVIMHLASYMREEDQLRDEIRLDAYTKAELHEELAMRSHSTYCYIFLDLANPDEMHAMRDAERRSKTAAAAKEFLLAVAEQEIWLGKWDSGYATFPATVYALLTDDAYQVEFKEKPYATDEEARDGKDLADPELGPMLERALSGDVQAQRELGSTYLKRVSRDWECIHKGFYWLRKAAEADDAIAQRELGCGLRRYILCGDQERAESEYWLEKAAAQ